MKLISVYSITLILFSVVTAELNATEDTDRCNQKERLKLSTHDIFDLSDPDTIFIHRWANLLHIKTKDKALYNEAAFFVQKCDIDVQDIAELERHLRSKKYIKDAKVSIQEETNQISIETWDNWSLMPTIDFSRKGGKNNYAIGIKDRNFLGLGIDAEIESFTNDQRSGYKFKTSFPLYLNNNIEASIRLTSNDDGTSEAIFLQKNFVSFDTPNAFNIGFNNFKQLDTQYNNGQVSNQFQHNQRYSTASWQWLDNDTNEDTLRFGIGYTNEQHQFFSLSEQPNSALPKNREFSYPFLSVEYLQKDFRKLTNLNLINHIEDFNLGWHITSDIGSDLGKTNTSPTIIWRSNLSKGANVFKDAYWLLTTSFDGEIYSSAENENRISLSISNEYFQKINENWGAYFKNVSQLSKNQYKDLPIALGGESGLRGYPLQYQKGDHSTQFTLEARYYPHINIYKLLEVGGAAFIDTGKVFSQSESEFNQESWMTSIGIGARFFSTQTSEARVIHIDIIKPMTNGENVNGVEFRITTKHSF